MYSPQLGRFLSTDPLVADPTILYDNNWFGERMTLMRNLYGYCRNSPTVRIDPSGLRCCGPDVTKWFSMEVTLFRAQAQAAYERFAGVTNIPSSAGEGGGAFAGAEAQLSVALRDLALKSDYKARTFSDPGCPRPCPNSVTICGKCIATNQLGNIMYGIIAVDLTQVDEARNYGRGNIPWYYRIVGATGPTNPWTVPGEAYRETAFNIGVQFARTGSGCALLNVNPNAPVDQGTASCTPCSAEFKGPHTSFNTKPLVDPAGNLRR